MWVVDVDGVGVTQGRSLREAERMAADLVVAVTQADPADVHVEFTVELEDGLSAQIQQARDATADAQARQREAAEQTRRLLHALTDKAGLSGNDVAHLLGVSKQRVSQVAAQPRSRTGRRG